MPTFANLLPGDPAPWFHQRSFANPKYAFDTAAGRYIVLCFFVSAGDTQVRKALDHITQTAKVFDDDHAAFFGVSIDPLDESEKRATDRYPGVRFLWDFDTSVSKLYGAVPADGPGDGTKVSVRRLWVVLDPTLRVIHTAAFAPTAEKVGEMLAYVAGLPPPERFAGVELQAPVLLLQNVFEPEFCSRLISLYEEHGGYESGFMRDVGGKTVAVNDHSHKRRRDYTITDNQIIGAAQARFIRRVVPEIQKVHQFKVTRMERHIVACYAAEDEAHFRAHRDNTTKGTAHRRFAVYINLNSDFEGGEVSFPEYGRRRFKPPPGGAVVFSCSLLHAVSKVTSGRRYAYLPFLYDDEAARIREANNQHLSDEVGSYRAG